MGLQADAKDITIARLAVALTLQDQRADDAEALVAQLRAELADIANNRANDTLTDSGAGNIDAGLDVDSGSSHDRLALAVEAHQVQEEEERHNSPLASSNGHSG